MLGPKPLAWSLTLGFVAIAIWMAMFVVSGLFDADGTSEQIQQLSKDGFAGLPGLLMLGATLTWFVASIGLISWARSLSNEDRWGFATFGMFFVLGGIVTGLVGNALLFVGGEAAADGEIVLATTALEFYWAVDWWSSIAWMLGVLLIAVSALQQKAANTIVVSLMTLGAAAGTISYFGVEALGMVGFPLTGLAISAIGIQKLRS